MSEKKNIWYSYDKVLSYNALLNFIIGERGVGKTYGIKVHALKHYLKTGKQFVYIRRYKTELKPALQNSSFFQQITNEPIAQGHELKNDGKFFYCDKKVCGYAIPLSTSNILKSSSYDNVDLIIFDEFILMNGMYRYLNDEVTQVLELIETVARLRDFRMFFLGNAITQTNPYFMYFDLSLPYKSDIKLFKDNSILVNYIKNETYRAEKSGTRFGKLISGTQYGEYAIDNLFLRDNETFIEKRPSNAKFYFTLKIMNFTMGVWYDKENKVYISKDYDPNYPIIVAFDEESHSKDTKALSKQNGWFKGIKNAYKDGLLYFENINMKNLLIPYISQSLF